jgi:2-amino-4-hydroxy-6-hydroxymethyldihydropteridine diphosphokinase
MSGADSATFHLGLGSNIGDRIANLREALFRLSRLPGVRVVRSSPVYESEPWGYADQADFLNAAVELLAPADPSALFRALKAIEHEMGRIPAERNHPRVIDLDILLAGDRVLTTEELAIPHPRMIERRFVLLPLCDIAPHLVHPVLRRPVVELLAACGDSGALKRRAEPLDPTALSRGTA